MNVAYMKCCTPKTAIGSANKTRPSVTAGLPARKKATPHSASASNARVRAEGDASQGGPEEIDWAPGRYLCGDELSGHPPPLRKDSLRRSRRIARPRWIVDAKTRESARMN